ncbi:MAG: V-type ATP synthase subunit F [Spirochaetes bacterium]|nr:V-type ATP synthase subunit F [Spirochaetota bacterium]
MQYVVIGDEETVLGFSLAGVEGKIARTEEQTLEFLKKYISTPRVGVIIITEKLASPHARFIDDYTYKETLPLIIKIPDRSGSREQRISVEEVIRKSVGIKI